MSTKADAVKHRALIELLKLYRSQRQCTSYVVGSLPLAASSRPADGYDVDVFFRIGDTVYTEGAADALYVELSRRIHTVSDSDHRPAHNEYRVQAQLPGVHPVPCGKMQYQPSSNTVIEPPAQACESFLRALLTRRHFEALVVPRLHDMMDAYRPAMQAGRRAYGLFVVLRAYVLIGKDLLWPVMQVLLRYWGGRGGID